METWIQQKQQSHPIQSGLGCLTQDQQYTRVLFFTKQYMSTDRIFLLSRKHGSSRTNLRPINWILLQKCSLPLINRGNYDDRRSGGIALIYRKPIECIKIKTNTTPTVEYLIIQLLDTTKPFHIIIIYRPPNRFVSIF